MAYGSIDNTSPVAIAARDKEMARKAEIAKLRAGAQSFIAKYPISKNPDNLTDSWEVTFNVTSEKDHDFVAKKLNDWFNKFIDGSNNISDLKLLEDFCKYTGILMSGGEWRNESAPSGEPIRAYHSFVKEESGFKFYDNLVKKIKKLEEQNVSILRNEMVAQLNATAKQMRAVSPSANPLGGSKLEKVTVPPPKYDKPKETVIIEPASPVSTVIASAPSDKPKEVLTSSTVVQSQSPVVNTTEPPKKESSESVRDNAAPAAPKKGFFAKRAEQKDTATQKRQAEVQASYDSKCPRCQKKIKKSYAFCPECGFEQPAT